MGNIVYVATSLDGYVANKEGSVAYLESIPNPDHNDFGWANFIKDIDALVMGRKTFETVLGFGVEWPYPKKVFVLSHKKDIVPKKLEDKVVLIQGTPEEIVFNLNAKGYKNLYIDGASVIQEFLKEDLIDEMIINKIPILLGGGTSLFGDLSEHIMFEHISTEILLNEMVMSHYKRKRNSNN